MKTYENRMTAEKQENNAWRLLLRVNWNELDGALPQLSPYEFLDSGQTPLESDVLHARSAEQRAGKFFRAGNWRRFGLPRPKKHQVIVQQGVDLTASAWRKFGSNGKREAE